jgi:hypothetical protein
MGRPNDNHQAELPLFSVPTVIVPAIRIPQPDGSILFKAGKPVVVEEQIGTAEAARLLGMSQRWVITECILGRFKTAYQPSGRVHGNWKIARTEVLARITAPPAE